MTISDENKIRLVLVVVGIGLGLVLGWIANALWFAFTGIILGWGDSAPDWYFNIRKQVQTSITVAAVLLTLIGLQLFFSICKRRKSMAKL
jgi:hypothetical protein